MKALLPASLCELARSARSSRFVEAVGSVVLLVDVADVTSELARAFLEESEHHADKSMPGFGYATVADVPADLLRRIFKARRPLDLSRLHALLSSSVFAIAPLRKRTGAGKAFSARISVGRALNNDVVLRHESVSKFHAWFAHEDGHYALSDAGSKNGTFVNGEALVPRCPVPVALGDGIRFGSVEAHFCGAELLASYAASAG